MGFTLRFILGTVLLLLRFWSIQTSQQNRNETEKLVNLTESNNPPKTELETNKTKQKPELARSIDIEKYISKDFHNKNNVYTLPVSPDTEKFLHGFGDHATTHKHVEDHADYDFESELTTPKSSFFDKKYLEAVESVDQKLEHIDDSHEISSESESKESINLEKLYEETKKNGTKAELDYVNYKNIISNDTGNRNHLHKDLIVEAGTNLNFQSSFNHTTIIGEDDSGNNTIIKEPEKVETTTLSNAIKTDLDNAESATQKNLAVTTRKTIVVTKPSSDNSSHISILSNKIETALPGKNKEVSDSFPSKAPIEVSKRLQVDSSPETSRNLQQENETASVPEQSFAKVEETTTKKEEITTIPEETTTKPEETTTKPEVTTTKPEETTKPEVTTTKPEETTKPEVTTTKPAETTVVLIQSGENTTSGETTTISQETTTEELTTLSQTTENTSQTEESTTLLTNTELPTTISLEQTTPLPIQNNTELPEVETLTSVVTQTSISPWIVTEKVQTTTPIETTTFLEEETTVASTYLSDSTEENATNKSENATTEQSIRTSKAMVFTEEVTTQTIEMSTNFEPNVRTLNMSTTDFDSSENTLPPDFSEQTDPPEDNSGTIAAIAISSIGAACLIILVGLLVIMRKRQKRFNYGQRCRPVSLDDYSMDNVSVCNNSVRRKALRASKRSYGNPAFEDPVTTSHPLNFPALGQFAGNLEEIRAEFEEIPQITARTTELPEGCDTKNRYANVIPLPETRVFLSSIDGCPNSDYINANYVTGPKNVKGYYIACQAPMQNTVDDFWRMVWEQQCKVILMLTHLFENGVEKCVDYLPPSEVSDCHRLFGDFQVTLKKREVKEKYIISSLQLKNMVSNSWREVTHFWYLGWPEKGVPLEANSLIAFLIEARSYMKSSSLDRKDVTSLSNGASKDINPVVVHCSPGTGRTGVVIACDIAIREFEQSRLVDVPRIVYRIRRDRASAVQTKEQYAFIYKVISLYATKLTGGALDSF